eukprot:TRINITY_DN6489_c0_g1_i2.p2 TRINITY_DN6489_c0_g1~~TRINITY_DN6489_c0_g1_i2.p2  ORF type:complete len:159 (-),score=44.74 TRINITY_DN6489_c0_g1_i2:7-483(-)
MPTFPDIPKNNNFPSFPDFPSTPSNNNSSAPSNFPSFPSVPSNSSAPKSPSSAPSDLDDYPDFAFPSVPTAGNNMNGGSVADKIALPSSSQPPSQWPMFPTVPSNSSVSADFSMNFPKVPSSTANGDTYASAGESTEGGDELDDFDDLTARFEALRKK